MKNILISQSIKNNSNNELVYGVEKSWYDFFNNPKVNLITLDSNKKIREKKISAIVLHGGGGNDLPKFVNTKENILRKKNDLNIFKYALRKKIPVLGVCYGFQLIAEFYNSRLIKIDNHVKKVHKLVFKNKKKKVIKIDVNSYHNYAVLNLPNFFNEITRCKDESIEYAKSDKKNLMCMMFHPERKNSNKFFLKKLIFNHFKI